MKGDTIQYVYTNSKHNNSLYRVSPIAIGNAQAESLSQYDKEKYKEMILDAAETVLGFWALIELFIVVISKRTKEEENAMTS